MPREPSNSYDFEYRLACGWVGAIADLFNMPDEFDGYIMGSCESTAPYVQALRVYLHYAFGIDCPGSAYIP